MNHKIAITAVLLVALFNPAVQAAEPAAGTPWTDPNTGIEFVYIPTGCFNMGSNEGDSDEKPVHKVCVKAFYLSKYEVTQAQWRKISGQSPSNFSGDSNPVEQVSWNDIKENLDEFNYQTKGKFRLPTEAEWEYACRAGGKHDTYCGAGRIDKLAWYDGNSGSQTHPVGKMRPNAWGLYDMSGNVWEWVQDWYVDSYSGAPADGTAQTDGEHECRVLRGGSWNNGPRFARTAYRGFDFPARRDGYYGFRLARALP